MSTENEVRCLPLTEEGKENLALVQNFAKEKGLNCVWVTSEETKNVVIYQKEVVYVVDPVYSNEESEKVVKRLVDLGFPVLGPQCILTQLKHGLQISVDMKFPLNTLTMYGTVVCFSNILNDERNKLGKMVEMMGGKVVKPLNHTVSHLVVGEVGSVKYYTAASYSIKIMVKDWIYHLWKVGISRYVCAKDAKWEEFLCPIFLGCKICMTGFSTAEKTKVQKLIAKFGGEYSGAMKLNYTTHLIVNKPEGQKFAMAENFGVKVVNINWFYDSIDKGTCLDSIKYPVKVDANVATTTIHHQSTPDKSAPSTNKITSMVDMSSIDPSTINETVASTMGDTMLLSTVGTTGKETGGCLLAMPVSSVNYVDVMDGMHIYVVGFSFQEEEKLNKLLSLAGAIKRAQLSPNVDRVIVGDPTRISSASKHEILTMSSENPDLVVVGKEWVIDSLMSGKIMPEKDYWQTSILPSEYEETRSYAISAEDTTLSSVATMRKASNVPANDGSMLGFLLPDDDDDTVLSQYVDRRSKKLKDSTLTTEDTLSQQNTSFPNQENLSHNDITLEQAEKTVAMNLMSMEPDLTVSGLFRGRTFFLFGFSNEETKSLISDIELNGGFILPANSKKIADFAVVPMTGWHMDKTATEVVTIFWVKYCIERRELLDPHGHCMSSPFSVLPGSMPLKDCVACLSKYRDAERACLSRLIVELGGSTQELVARRDMTNLKKTTHLIIREPGGDKYVGCKRWGVVIVNENWVYESASKGVKVDEGNYLVKECTELQEPTTEEPKNSCSTINGKNVHSTGWNSDFPPMPRPPSAVNKIRERLELKNDLHKKALEDMVKSRETPVATRYKRMQSDLETPSKFMKRSRTPINISFDLTEVFSLLKTPVEQQQLVLDEARKNPDTPLSTILSRCLDTAVKNIPDHLIENLEARMTVDQNDDQEVFASSDKENAVANEANSRPPDEEILQNVPNIFEGLVISLAAKLHKDFSELSKIVVAHGGEFRWTYDNSCTHFLFQGRSKDKNKEYCAAKKDGKNIVTPYWVEYCVLAKEKLDESLYPHVYDPKKSIQVTSQSQKMLSQSKSCVQTRGISDSVGSSPENDNDTPKRKRTKKDFESATDSQEGRDLLQKKLANIMAKSSITRDQHVHRLSISRSSISSPAQRRTSTVITNQPPKEGVELSQDVQVSWDDPTGREEMMRLMSKDEENFSIMGANFDPAQNETRDDHHVDAKNPSEMRFLMSSIAGPEKSHYAALISELGAEFVESSCFDASSTHLLVSKPGRSEKYLSALASGRYILHPQYLEECKKQGKLVNEDPYEYGNPENPDTKNFLVSPDVLQSMISLSAYRWRKRLEAVESTSRSQVGAFAGWKILLLVNDRQKKGFERLLKCGHAEVLGCNESKLEITCDATHIFVDQEHAKALDSSVVDRLITNSGVHICDQSYIGDFLLKDPPPCPTSYYITQAASSDKVKSMKN